MLIKIKTYKIRQSGYRGMEVALPRTWIEDKGLKPGALLDFHIDPEKPDSLILTIVK